MDTPNNSDAYLSLFNYPPTAQINPTGSPNKHPSSSMPETSRKSSPNPDTSTNSSELPLTRHRHELTKSVDLASAGRPDSMSGDEYPASDQAETKPSSTPAVLHLPLTLSRKPTNLKKQLGKRDSTVVNQGIELLTEPPTKRSATNQDHGTDTQPLMPSVLALDTQAASNLESSRNPHEVNEIHGVTNKDSRAPTAAFAVSSVEKSSSHEIPVYNASALNPEVTAPWKFIGRVLARNPVREYKTWRGHGKLFEVYATDENADLIRATIFNEGVESFHDLLVPGATCSFSNGRVKTPNTAFGRSVTVELSFGGDAEIRQEQNTPSYPEPTFQYTSLAHLPNLPPDETPTICGVITQIGPLKKITTRKQKATVKRDFLLADDSDTEILCTVWGQTAEELQDSLQGHVILLKDGQVSDYRNVRSVTASLGTTIFHDPAITRCAELSRWFANIASDHKFTSLHS